MKGRKQGRVSRREFLQRAGMATAAGTLGTLVAPTMLGGATPRERTEGASPLEQPAGGCPRFGVFDDHTFATLVQIAEQIIPADEDPGNADLCAASLVEASAAADAGLADLVSAGIAGIDQSSTILFGDLFRNLSFARQREVLERVEAGAAPGTFWNSALMRQFTPSPGQPIPPGLRRVVNKAHAVMPQGLPFAGAVIGAMGSSAQQAVFASLRVLCKLAFLLNFPETLARDPVTRLPIFSDPEHLISDPDDSATKTGWGIVNYHVVDFETEKLLWEWQTGRSVVGFNGVPTLGDRELSTARREAARDALYAMSLRGEA